MKYLWFEWIKKRKCPLCFEEVRGLRNHIRDKHK